MLAAAFQSSSGIGSRTYLRFVRHVSKRALSSSKSAGMVGFMTGSPKIKIDLGDKNRELMNASHA